MDLAGLTLSLVTLVSPKQIAKTFQQKPTWVLYICIGVWLLVQLKCGLSQAQNKILLKAEEMHKMANISLKICSASVTFLSLRNLKAAPEEAIQLRRLIKSSNESSGPYLLGKFEFWNFQSFRFKKPSRCISKEICFIVKESKSLQDKK